MNALEKRKLVGSLERGRRALLKSLRGVSAETAVRTPIPGKWTILDCVEHVAVSEDYLLAQIESATYSGTPAIPPQREALIAERALDRSFRFESPQAVRPIGQFPTLAAALEHFLASRERTMRWVESAPPDLRNRIASHPLIGPTNCYEMLLMMALHPRRHAEQIEEIKVALEALECRELEGDEKRPKKPRRPNP